MKILKPLFFVLFLLLIWNSKDALAQNNKPTILETTLLKASYGDQLMINGLVEKNNQVLIYINGNYYGFANISNNDPDINSFSYLSPVIKRVSDYNYKIFAIARNLDSLNLSALAESGISSIIEQSSIEQADKKPSEQLRPKPDKTKEEQVPAPILITPKGNIGEYKPIISGFSKNQTKINLYIDNALETEFWVEDDNSGTASFKYTPVKELKRGLHLVYAIATDKNGRKSKNSNFLYFFIADPKYIATSTSLVQETPAQPSVFQKTENTASSSNQKENTKPINSALNLSLFILFIVGVIIWIITTNLELKKEKAKTEEEKPKQ